MNTQAPPALPSHNHPGGRRVFYIPLVTAFVSLALLFLAVGNGWFGEWTHTGSRFCESSRPGLIKQPVNTWSNAGFVFAGIAFGWLLMRGTFGRNKNALTQNTFYAAFFASLVVLIGPCSMAMHATETEIGGFLDLLSMHLMAAFITAYAMQRFFQLSPAGFVGLFAAVTGIGVYAQSLPHQVPVVGQPGSLMFGVFILTGTVFELLNSFVRKKLHERKWGFLSAGFILLAFLIWNLSLTGAPCCRPDSVIQGHGLWHLLCAVSLCCLFRYYVSENPGVAPRR